MPVLLLNHVLEEWIHCVKRVTLDHCVPCVMKVTTK